ncbi:TPA: hypothetical protein PRT27_002933 [Escherichia coli]|nr:hypothetical protein [Escherichia coli]
MHKKTCFCCAQVPGEQPAIWGLKASSEIARNAADSGCDAVCCSLMPAAYLSHLGRYGCSLCCCGAWCLTVRAPPA